MAWWCEDRDSNSAELRYVLQLRSPDSWIEEGSETTPVNGDPRSEKLASELGPSCQSLEGTRDVNIESLYEACLASLDYADPSTDRELEYGGSLDF